LKGILTELPADTVHNIFVMDLIKSGFPSTFEDLTAQINIQPKLVWVSESMKFIEKALFSETALKFIKDYCNRFHVACCNFILTELKTSLETYHPSFASR
jgi:hypothetical protein